MPWISMYPGASSADNWCVGASEVVVPTAFAAAARAAFASDNLATSAAYEALSAINPAALSASVLVVAPVASRRGGGGGCPCAVVKMAAGGACAI